MTTDQKAGDYAKTGFESVFGRLPTDDELLFLLGVGSLETQYGDGWQGAGLGSNNIGAITAGNSWTGSTFVYKDSYPDSQGVNHTYTTKFRKYQSPEEGWADLARVEYEQRANVLAAATLGDAYGVSEALYQTHYYAGFGKTPGERIANHYRALASCVRRIAAALGLSLPGSIAPVLPTIRRGSRGDIVRTWQRIIVVAADGMFGPITEQASCRWQQSHSLLPDGVVGPKTWAAAHSLGLV